MDKDSAWGALLRRYGRIFSEAWRARHEMQGLSHTREEAQFFAADLGSVGNAAAAFSANDFVGGDAVFLWWRVIWAIIGRTDIVATASGKIIPMTGLRWCKRLKPALFKKLECVTAIP